MRTHLIGLLIAFLIRLVVQHTDTFTQNQVGSCSFEFFSFNVRGLREEKKRHSIFRFLRRKKVDVCLLQETHSTLREEDIWKNQWGGNIIFNHGASNSKGVMILIRPGFDLKVIDTEKDSNGRFLSLHCQIQGTPFRVYNLYGPNADNQRLLFYKELQKRLERDSNLCDNIIIGGDFNLIPSETLDRKGGNFTPSCQYKETLKVLELVQAENNIIDIWRLKNPNTKRYTWRQKRPPIASRLDFWLVSLALSDYVRDVDILPSIKSDHSPINLKIETFETSKGRGLWKLNSSFLEDDKYKQGVIEVISELKEEVIPDKIVFWEYLKFKIREFSVQYGKEKARFNRDNERELEESLKNLTSQLDECQEDEEKTMLIKQMDDITEKLVAIDRYKTEGIIMRAKCQYYEKGERSNSYFLRLAARNKIKTTMNKLMKEDGVETCNPVEILQMQKQFYEKLYSSRDTNSLNEKTTYLDNIEVNSLNGDESKSCEGLLTSDEVMKAITDLKSNKTPGNDGLTGEFYKHFCGVLVHPLQDALNAGYINGKLSTSQRQAVISLLDKGKDRTLLKNWRPLSMLNTDYKIATKAIAERIKPHLPKLVHPNQAGYVQGRQIANNIRAISDIYDYTKENGIPGILVNLDFEKAFDSVDWDFLNLVLKKYNFGVSLRRWIEVFYSDISSCVLNNGSTSNYFKLGRGVRQGDPLSPYLFILVVEILACSIRQNKSIKGIMIDHVETKILQYADDTNGALSDVGSLKHFLKVVDRFGDFSGLKLNRSKSEATWLGSLRNNETTPLGIAWPKEPLRTLGVYISYDEEKCNELNFHRRLEKCRQILNEWKQRNLTMLGRALIIRTFIVSQFLFTCGAVEIPDRFLSELEKFMFDFVWKGKKPKLKREVLFRKLEEGGVNMPDVRTMLKVNKIRWIQRYLYSEHHLWKHSFRAFLEASGVDLDVLLFSNYRVNSLNLNHVPKFYVDMLSTWSDVRDIGVSQFFLWYNEGIKIDNKVLFLPKWHTSGINFVHDLLHDDGSVRPFQSLKDRGLDNKDWFIWQSIVRIVRTEPFCKFNENPSEITLQVRTKDLSKVESKFLYSYLLEKKCSKNDYGRLIQYFGKNDVYSNLAKRSFLLTKSSISDPTLREFHFKFMHDILVNNYWLEKWQIRVDSYCSFCKKEIENILHMYYECNIIRQFWTNVMSWLGIYPDFSKDTIFFGSDDALYFLILMVAKKYIYNCRLSNSLPNVIALSRVLRGVRDKEFQIANNRGKVDDYLDKWRAIVRKLE